MSNDNHNNGNATTMSPEECAKVVAISLDLQGIAMDIQDRLDDVAGERLAFVLVVSVGKVAQYVSNASRADGMLLLEWVQEAWKKNGADIPAHAIYNPEQPQ